MINSCFYCTNPAFGCKILTKFVYIRGRRQNSAGRRSLLPEEMCFQFLLVNVQRTDCCRVGPVVDCSVLPARWRQNSSIRWMAVLRICRLMYSDYLCQYHVELGTMSTCLSADIHHASEHGRHLRSSSYRSLAAPRTRTTFGDRSFTVAGPRVWNSLLATLRQITSYGQFTEFRRHLKTHLFRA